MDWFDWVLTLLCFVPGVLLFLTVVVRAIYNDWTVIFVPFVILFTIVFFPWIALYFLIQNFIDDIKEKRGEINDS